MWSSFLNVGARKGGVRPLSIRTMVGSDGPPPATTAARLSPRCFRRRCMTSAKYWESDTGSNTQKMDALTYARYISAVDTSAPSHDGFQDKSAADRAPKYGSTGDSPKTSTTHRSGLDAEDEREQVKGELADQARTQIAVFSSPRSTSPCDCPTRCGRCDTGLDASNPTLPMVRTVQHPLSILAAFAMSRTKRGRDQCCSLHIR